MQSGYQNLAVYGLIIVCFFMLEYLAYSKSSNKIIGQKVPAPVFSIVLMLNIAGIVLYGLVSYSVSESPNETYFNLPMPSKISLIWVFLLGDVVCLISFFSAHRATGANRYPIGQGNEAEKNQPVLPAAFSTKNSVVYLIVRAIYLFAYEYFFRGVLLFSIAAFIGWFWAVVINVFLYFLLHLFSSKKEMLATIPFGFALCYVSYAWQSFFPAFILHVALCFTYEGLIFYNYFMHFKKSAL